MRITWFGGTVFRIQTGGSILTLDATLAKAGVDRRELTGGAGLELALASGTDAHLADWTASKTRRPARPIDFDDTKPVEVTRVGGAALHIAGAGDPPVLVVAVRGADRIDWRAAEDSVLVLVGAVPYAAVGAALDAAGARPRLTVLAGARDDDFAMAAAALGDRGPLQNLESGLALEV